MKPVIRIAHSPDADDRLMFWAIKQGRLISDRYAFEIHEADTQTLNRLATGEEYDIIAVSAAHYASIHAIYQPLRMGTSVGSGYGPVVVTLPHTDASILPAPGSQELQNWTLLSPGLQTTAHNALRVLGYHFGNVLEVPIQPMSLIFEKLHSLSLAAKLNGKPALIAALVIHEGRLTFESEGTILQLDLGLAWQKRFGCNLPLGINVIKRSLPVETREYLSTFLRQSMQAALLDRKTFEDEYAQSGPLDRNTLQTYLKMYANETTLDISAEDRAAFDLLTSEVLKSHSVQGALANGQTGIIADWI